MAVGVGDQEYAACERGSVAMAREAFFLILLVIALYGVAAFLIIRNQREQRRLEREARPTLTEARAQYLSGQIDRIEYERLVDSALSREKG